MHSYWFMKQPSLICRVYSVWPFTDFLEHLTSSSHILMYFFIHHGLQSPWIRPRQHKALQNIMKW